MEKDAILKVKFDGQSHQIDANTLINFLIHYTSVINEANRLYGNGKEIDIKINALEKGSFIIDLSLAAKNFLADIFRKENVSYLADLAAVIGGIFAVYKFKKGKPAKTEDDIRAINVNVHNEIRQTVVNIYNMPVIREAISKSFENVSQDSSVEGVSFFSGEDGQVGFGRDEFTDMIYNDFDKEENIPGQRVVVDDDAVLVIAKLSFEKGSMWSFNYRGFRINVPVKDNALMKMIDEGERFGKGDAIRVTLVINQAYNKELRSYENRSYRIEAFHEHIQAPSGVRMFDRQ